MTGLVCGATVAVLLANLSVAVAQPSGPPPCPSFDELTRRTDAKVKEILGLKPGMSLKEFTQRHAFQTLNFWDDVGADKDTTFGVAVTDGNAQVSDTLVCRFDRRDFLQGCKHECCRYTTRTITEAQYNALLVGRGRPEVERTLCSPSDSEPDPKKPGRVSLYYHINLPIGHHDEGQTVLLVFEGGKLVSKDMSPYY